VRRERFGAAGAWGQYAPAALIWRWCPAPQLHRLDGNANRAIASIRERHRGWFRYGTGNRLGCAGRCSGCQLVRPVRRPVPAAYPGRGRNRGYLYSGVSCRSDTGCGGDHSPRAGPKPPSVDKLPSHGTWSSGSLAGVRSLRCTVKSVMSTSTGILGRVPSNKRPSGP